MIYVVSGYMRSGTTMMMEALVTGGLTGAYREDGDIYSLRAGKLLYELGRCPNCLPSIKVVQSEGRIQVGVSSKREKPCQGYPCIIDFRTYPQDYEERVVKVLCNTQGSYLQDVLKDGPKYKVLFMLRDPIEIKASMESFFRRPAPSMVQDPETYLTHVEEMFRSAPYSKLQVQFRKVVEEPLAWFKFMKAMGWPIDPEAAAATVNEEEYHHRKENILAEGERRRCP
jgi:hypothetical protein